MRDDVTGDTATDISDESGLKKMTMTRSIGKDVRDRAGIA